MLRYPICEPEIGKEEEALVVDCIRSNWISSLGKYISEFENGFAKKFHRKYALTVSNGTTALHLALLGLNIGPGDEVLVPALTFVACANAVMYVGAKPVFVDSDPRHWNLDPQNAAKKITKKTKAIMAVHLYGHPAEIQPLADLAKAHNLALIEDCAEAHAALYQGRPIGSFGKIAVFSFYGNKVMTTGEGGMILLDDESLTAKLKQLRDHNMDPKRRYFHPGIGFNYRMTNLQAAIGVAQLAKLDGFVNKKRQIAAWYDRILQNHSALTLPPRMPWAEPIFWLYSILCSSEKQCLALQHTLHKEGIDSRPFFIPMNQLPYTGGSPDDCKVALDLSRRGINLPSSTKLTESDVELIATTITKSL